MIRFFNFLGNAWQLIALAVMFILFLSFVTGVVVNKLSNSHISLMMIILYYCIVFTIWAIILLLGVPAYIKYLVSLY